MVPAVLQSEDCVCLTPFCIVVLALVTIPYFLVTAWILLLIVYLFFFFRINLSYRAFTISKKGQGGGRVELYVNRLYKGFLDRPRFFLLRCFKLSIFNNKCTFFFQHWLWWCFFFLGGISHTEQLSIIFLQHWHHNSKCKLLNKSCSYRNIYLDLCN